MKIVIEMDDVLSDCVNSAIEETKTLLMEYLTYNNLSDCDLNDLDNYGQLHEIIDSSVPVYTKQIKDAWYLHGDELTDAYLNAGIGNNPMDNDGMAAIYCYIQQEVNNWFCDNKDDLFAEAEAA